MINGTEFGEIQDQLGQLIGFLPDKEQGSKTVGRFLQAIEGLNVKLDPAELKALEDYRDNPHISEDDFDTIVGIITKVRRLSFASITVHNKTRFPKKGDATAELLRS